MSFRFLVALGCCFVYSTTASAGVKLIVDDTGDNKSFKVTYSTKCGEGEHLYNGHCEKDCVGYFLTLTQVDENKGVVEPCREKGQYKYRYTSCKEGWNEKHGTKNGKDYIEDCILSGDCNDYFSGTFDHTIGNVECIQCGDEEKCRYKECNPGYNKTNRGKNCEPKNCDTDPYYTTTSLNTDQGSVITCLSGKTTWYGYESCNLGWQNDLHGHSNASEPIHGKCEENECEGYRHNTSPIPHCDEDDYCKKGYEDRYRCTKASDGYDLDDGEPVPHVCSGFEHKCDSSTCIIRNGQIVAIDGCDDFDQCRSGEDYYYTCTGDQCEGFTSISEDIPHCTKVSPPCQKGGQKLYKCEICENCYKLNDSGTCSLKDAHTDPEKFCPYYEGDQVIGVVFNIDENKFGGKDVLIMGLKNYGNLYEYLVPDPSGHYSSNSLSVKYALWQSIYPEDVDIEGLANFPDETDLKAEAEIKNGYPKGQSNTEAIIDVQGLECYNSDERQCTAAQLCAKETLGGKTWFLPSIGEWVKGFGGLKDSNENGALVGYTDQGEIKEFNEASQKYGEPLLVTDIKINSSTGSSLGHWFWTSTEHNKTQAVVIGNDRIDGNPWSNEIRIKYGQKDAVPGFKDMGKDGPVHTWFTRCFFYEHTGECDECSEYDELKGICEPKFKKFCPYYNDEGKVIGIVFDEESKLVMGLYNYGSAVDDEEQAKASTWHECNTPTTGCNRDIIGLVNYKITQETPENDFHTMFKDSNGEEYTVMITEFAKENHIPHEAAQLCWDEGEKAYIDLFLPTIGQWAKGLGEYRVEDSTALFTLGNWEKFNLASQQYGGDPLYGAINGNSDILYSYWSSTEENGEYAWAMYYGGEGLIANIALKSQTSSLTSATNKVLFRTRCFFTAR